MKRTFSEEFKLEAVRLVVDQGVPPGQAASDLGIGRSTLEKWLRKYRESDQSEELSLNEREELRRLRKENHRLKMERDILKKATAFFSRTTLPEGNL